MKGIKIQNKTMETYGEECIWKVFTKVLNVRK